MRATLALVGLLFAAGFAYVAIAYPSSSPNSNVLYVIAAFCLLIPVACIGGKVGNAALRTICGTVCLLYVAYVVSEIFALNPRWASGRQSQPSVLNAILGFVVIGLPCGAFALFGGLRENEDREGDPALWKLEDELQMAFEDLAYCRWEEFHPDLRLDAVLATLGPDIDWEGLQPATREAAREHAVRVLSEAARDPEYDDAETGPAAYADRFLACFGGSGDPMNLWTVESVATRGIVARAGHFTGILILVPFEDD